MNFCHPRLEPQIECNSLSSDGYEVSNLISKDVLKRDRGFIADSFIKPPVDIMVNFMCGINIRHILVWPQVGNQKSTNFEIFSKISSPSGKSQIIGGNCEGTEHGIYYRIGRGSVNCEDGIAFKNPRYSQRKEKQNMKKVNNVPSNFAVFELDSRLAQALTNSCGIKIRIYKTSGSSVPALKKLEVWGEPSYFVIGTLKRKVNEQWTSSKCETVTVPVSKEKTISNHSSGLENHVSKASNNVCVPEEFRDAITCEIMVFPIILPSGNVIDQSTLEKHSKEEALWGRGPSDPFTGRLFTEAYKPVFNSVLKARIDKFLVESEANDEIDAVGRTLDGKTLLRGNTLNTFRTLGIASHLDKSCTSNDKIPSELALVRKRSQREETKNTCNIKVERFAEGAKEPKRQRTHEEILDESLDLALKKTLKGLSSFTQEKPEICTSTDDVACGNCQKDTVLFKLPCSHFLCRVCLSDKVKCAQLVPCAICGLNFSSKDVQRFHV